MELARKIIDFVLEHEGEDEFVAYMMAAQKLAYGLDEWDGKKALGLLFGGETDAE